MKRAVCIPNLNRVKIKAEGRCYLPTRLRGHGRVLARCLNLVLLLFGFFQKSQNMSHGNGSSTFVFQVMGILKPVTVSTDTGLQLSHSPMVGCHSLYGSNFDW